MDQFLLNPERSEFISLAGYVYAYKEPFPSADTQKCLAYDPSFVRILEKSGQLTRQVAKWLNFTTLCAYPVFRNGNPDDDVMGVLVAFRNVPKGITSEDEDALLTLSCLLGSMLSLGDGKPSAGERGVSDA